jgi:Domain of unknown function (DUF4864)
MEPHIFILLLNGSMRTNYSRFYLRPSVILIGILILAVHPVLADDLNSRSLQEVIQEQLKAFNADDYPGAYRYASRHIQDKFSLEEFRAMVRSGYPQIARSLRNSFGVIVYSEDRLHASARVDVTGVDHVTVRAEYRMVMEDGRWKIDGVILLGRTTPT